MNPKRKISKLPKSHQEQIRQNIVNDFFQEKKTTTEIAVKYNKKLASISRIINTYKKKKTTQRKKGSGQSKGLDKSGKLRVRQQLKRTPRSTCEDFVEELELHCSPEIMRRNLHQMNIHFRYPAIKPFLSEFAS